MPSNVTSPPAPNGPAPVHRADMVHRHWLANRRISAWLLAVWFAVTMVVTYFARELSFAVLGWPFSFWVAAQGAPLVCLGLVALYAHRMRVIDDAHAAPPGVEPDAPAR